jgi:hypothetical protein
MRLWLLFLVLPFLLNAEAIWQADLPKPFMLTIKMHSQQMLLGDSLEVEVELHYPSSYQIDMTSLIDQWISSLNPLTPQWRLIQFQTSSLPTQEKIQAQHLSLKMAPITTGRLELSFLRVTFSPKETTLSPLSTLTPIFSVDVLPSPPLTAASLSPAPLIPLEPEFPLGLTLKNRALLIDHPQQLEKVKVSLQIDLAKHAFPWVILILLLGCGGIGWTLYLVRERWPKRAVKTVMPISPKQQINQALQALQKQPFNQEFATTYYAQLASLLLDALEARLGWKTKNSTTLELAQAMKQPSSLFPHQIEKVLSLLTEMDQVKFAGKKPSQPEIAQISQQVRELIQELI